MIGLSDIDMARCSCICASGDACTQTWWQVNYGYPWFIKRVGPQNMILHSTLDD